MHGIILCKYNKLRGLVLNKKFLLVSILFGISFTSSAAGGINCYRGAVAGNSSEDFVIGGGCIAQFLVNSESSGVPAESEGSGTPVGTETSEGGFDAGTPEEWELAIRKMTTDYGMRVSALDPADPHVNPPVNISTSYPFPDNYHDWAGFGGLMILDEQLRDEHLPDAKYPWSYIDPYWSTSARLKGERYSGKGLSFKNNLLTHTEWFTPITSLGVLSITSDTLTNLDGFRNLEIVRGQIYFGGSSLVDIKGLTKLHRAKYIKIRNSINLKDISPLSNMTLLRDSSNYNTRVPSLTIQPGSDFTIKLDKDGTLCEQIKNGNIHVNFTYNSYNPELKNDPEGSYLEYCE
jgi:hypothetical protein